MYAFFISVCVIRTQTLVNVYRAKCPRGSKRWAAFNDPSERDHELPPGNKSIVLVLSPQRTQGQRHQRYTVKNYVLDRCKSTVLIEATPNATVTSVRSKAQSARMPRCVKALSCPADRSRDFSRQGSNFLNRLCMRDVFYCFTSTRACQVRCAGSSRSTHGYGLLRCTGVARPWLCSSPAGLQASDSFTQPSPGCKLVTGVPPREPVVRRCEKQRTIRSNIAPQPGRSRIIIRFRFASRVR